MLAILETISGDIWSRLAIRKAISARMRRRKGGQQGSRLRGIEVRKDQGDCLRVFAVNEFGELLRIRFLECIEVATVGAERLDEPVEHLLGDFRTEGVDQNFFGIIHAAFYHEIFGYYHLIKLVQDAFGLLWRNLPQSRDFAAHKLDFVFA